MKPSRLLVIAVFIFAGASAAARQSAAPVQIDLKECSEHLSTATGFSLLPVKIEDQGQRSICTASAYKSSLEQRIFLNHGLKVPLSLDYLVWLKLRNWSLTANESRTEEQAVSVDFMESTALVFANGILPEEVWSPNRDMRQEAVQEKLIAEMNRVDRGDRAAQQKILDKYFGVPPRKFRFRGETFTPLSFRERFIDLENQMVVIHGLGNWKGDVKIPESRKTINPEGKVVWVTIPTNTIRETDPDVFWNDLRQVTTSLRPVVFSTTLPTSFRTWNLPKNCSERASLSNTHSMAVLGFGADKRQEDTLVLQNSWGDNFGQSGTLELPRNYIGKTVPCYYSTQFSYFVDRPQGESPALKFSSYPSGE